MEMFFLLNSITNTEIIKLVNTMSVLWTYTNSQIDVKRVDLANVYKPGKVYKFNAFLGKSLKSGSWNPKYLYLLEHKKKLKASKSKYILFALSLCYNCKQLTFQTAKCAVFLIHNNITSYY